MVFVPGKSGFPKNISARMHPEKFKNNIKTKETINEV